MPTLGQGGPGLEEMPAQCQPGQAHGVWAAGRKRSGCLPDDAGGGGLLRKGLAENSGPPSPRGGAGKGTHTCLSYARNEAPHVRAGRSLPGGRRLGKGPEPAEPGRPCRPWGETEEGKSSQSWGPSVPPGSGGPVRAQAGMKWGVGPGRM